MARTFFLKDAAVGAGGNGSLADGVQPGAAATTTTETVSSLGGALGDLQVYAGSATANAAASEPVNAPNSAGDSWRSELALSGTIPAGTWTVKLVQTKSGAGANTTAINFRVWKSANADGSGATEITAGLVATGSDGVASPATATFNPGQIVLAGEYLFLQIGWTRGEASISSNTWTINVGANSFLQTPDFLGPPVAWQRSTGPFRRGNPNPVGRFRSALAWPAAAGPATYDDTLSETAAATDAVVAVQVFAESITDAAAAADSLVGGLLLTGDLAESVAAADSLASSGAWANLVAEAGGAVDTVSAQAVFASALSESVAAADALLGNIVVPITESGAASDSLLDELLLGPGRAQRTRAARPIIFHEGRRTFDVWLWEEVFATDRLVARTAFGAGLVERVRAADVYGTDRFAVLAETARAAFGLDARLDQGDGLVELLRAAAAYAATVEWANGRREEASARDVLGSQQVTHNDLGEAVHADAQVTATIVRADTEEELIMAVMLLLGRRVAKAAQPLDRDRPIVNMMRLQLQQICADFLRRLGHHVADQARRVGKAAGDDKEGAVAASDGADYEPLRKDAAARLREVAKDGAHRGLEQVRADVARLLAQANKRAVEWADQRAGELIVEIGDTTRARVRDLVRKAEEEGWSNDKLADELAGDGVFGEARALKIARTETADADVQGNLIGWKESGVVAQKEWAVAQDSACDVCEPFDGLVVDLDADFPEGDPPVHPNCVLPGTLVSAAGVSAHFKRWFEGEVVRFVVEGHDDLTVTPNHPVLTAHGWRPAGEVCEGDYLVEAFNPSVAVRAANPDDHHVETRIEEIAGALLMAGGVATSPVPVAPEDFHGDGFVHQEVDVVLAERALHIDGEALSPQTERERALLGPNMQQESLASRGSSLQLLRRDSSAADSGVRRSGEARPLLRLCPAHAELHARAAVAKLKAEVRPTLSQGGAVASELPRDLDARLAGHVALVKVAKVVRGEQWAGHVYNLQTDGGWYIAAGLVIHNCRCDVLPVLADEAEE